MENGSLSEVTECVFTTFPMLQDGSLLYFILLHLIYTFIVIGNLLTFFAVRFDSHLHNPNMLSNLISEEKSITVTGCLLQMYFFHPLANSEGILLIVMAVAICNLLRYQMIMTPRLCVQLSACSCIFGFLILLPEIVMISTLPFCGHNQVHQLFCDLVPVPSLACTDTSMIVIEDVIHAVAIIITVLIIALSYVRNVIVMLRIPSAEGRKKAFSTCAGHLVVFLIFFGSVSLIYLHFNATYPPVLDRAIALMFTVLAPFFNSIIYSLRNKDMKNVIKRLLCHG